MARTAALAACLWLIIFTPFAPSSCGAAASPPILEKTLSISPWHIHLSQQRFASGGASNELLRLTKVGAEPRIKDGLITLNGRIILLHSFFRSSESVFEKQLQLKDGNLLIALLAGEPGARLKLEILADQPPEDSPLILALDAEPEVIKKGQSSRLSWKTEHAEICVMEPGVGRVDVSGALFVSPAETTRYTLTASGRGDPASASVTVTVADSAPEAEPQQVTTAEDEETSITLSASDPDGDELGFRIETWPSHGTLRGELQELIYKPAPQFHGSDGFTFTAGDAERRSEPALVAITVLSVNDPPVARPGPNQAVRVGETVVLDGSQSEDLDQDPLSFDWAFAAKPAGSTSVGRWCFQPTALPPIRRYWRMPTNSRCPSGIHGATPAPTWRRKAGFSTRTSPSPEPSSPCITPAAAFKATSSGCSTSRSAARAYRQASRISSSS